MDVHVLKSSESIPVKDAKIKNIYMQDRNIIMRVEGVDEKGEPRFVDMETGKFYQPYSSRGIRPVHAQLMVHDFTTKDSA